MSRPTDKQLDWTTRFTHIETRTGAGGAPGNPAPPGGGKTVQPPASVPPVQNPYDPDDWGEVWQQGFDLGFANPDEPHPAPSPMVEDGRKIFAEGVEAGKKSAGQAAAEKSRSGPDDPPAPAKPPGKTFTKNPREGATQTTSPKTVEVDKMLKGNWPELTEQGARTLTAQFVAETGGGKSCFNWNLGNQNAKPDEPHHFLVHVCEIFPTDKAEGYVARGGGLARILTAEEAKKNGFVADPGKQVVMFEPPHGMCRFKSFDSLEDGAKKWIEKNKDMAKKDPRLVTALNSGDTETAAKILGAQKYYTDSVEKYAAALKDAKAKVDKELDAR